MKEELIKSGQEKIRAFIDANSSWQTAPTVANNIKKLQIANKEFDSNQFIILVVGGVKSGKSTLVNLFAHETVSPTHFLECTVRPSIISKGKNREIIQYTLKPENDKTDAFNAIIDYVRGIEDKEDLISKVDSKSYELNPHNLSLYVELNMNEDNIKNDNTLITNITTLGGYLLNGDTVIIDMPGLDGGYANFDNPLYKQVAERADIIIFVQSSNSAITKISEDFLNLLIEKNKKVPVCLVHNVFDATYWRSEEEKKEQIATQVRIAVNKIKDKGFNVLSPFTINLGKVADADIYPENMDLQFEKVRFEKMEEGLFETIKEKRNQIHEEICVSKVMEASDALTASSEERRDKLLADEKKLELLNISFDNFISAFKNTSIKKDETESEIRNFFENKKQDWIQEIESLSAICNKHVSDREKTTVTRKRIDEYAEDATKVITNYLSSGEFINYLNQKINTKLQTVYQNHYSELMKFLAENDIQAFLLPEFSINKAFEFNFDGESRKIVKVYRWGGRKRQEVCELVNARKDMFIGYSEQGKKHQGKLQQSVIPEMAQFYTQEIEESLERFKDNVCDLILQEKEKKIPEYKKQISGITTEITRLKEMELKLNDIYNLFDVVRKKYFEE